MKTIQTQLCLALLTPFLSSASIFMVTNTADSGAGSLRQAILNANAVPGRDSIQFSIPGVGPHTITPLSPLPTITDAVWIDGTTQPGFNGLPLIELNGAQAGAGANGLWITAGNSEITGLVINRFSNDGILMQLNGTNIITGNFIGTDLTGTIARANTFGIVIDGSGANTIGSPDAADRNVISGNSLRGLRLVNTSDNVVVGNFIGTDLTGTARVGNASDGLMLDAGSTTNTIGGTEAGEGNLIAANGGNGIYMVSASFNVVQGNLIGTDVTGAVALGNGLCGMNLSGSGLNTIGGTDAGARNVISGNNNNGIELSSPGTTGNVIQGNLIGTDLAGTHVLGNFASGIFLGGAPNNLLGTSDPGAGNLISGNGAGVLFFGIGATGNSLENNFIGTDLTGKLALGNGVGVWLDSAPANAIGTVDAGNVISGNTGDGIDLVGLGASNNSIEGNTIGADATGTHVLPNQGSGVLLSGAPMNTIGGTAAVSRNLISGNAGSGISVAGAADGNVIQGNYIGADTTGAAALGNSLNGLTIADASGLTIGGTEAGAGNLVSGNLSSGILLGGRGHVVQGNWIGTDATGTKPLPNLASGIIAAGTDHTIGSDTSAGQNVVSANSQNGVALAGALNCTVFGNFIGADITGSHGLGNGANGLLLESGAQNNTIGGTGVFERNIIGGNGGNGILLRNPTTSTNAVLGNLVGLSAATNPLPNRLSGVALTNGVHDNFIGGTGDGEGNRIAYNNGSGILVQDNATFGNSLRGNSIFSNGGLGINLRPPGEPAETVTANDPLDADTGPNRLQNYPVLTNIIYSPGFVIVQGYLRSTPNRTGDNAFDLDFFSNSRTEPSGFGEGEVYLFLSDSSVETDATGYGEFTFQISGNYSNQYFTATATDPTTGDTSEFSEGKGGLRITAIQRAGANVLVSFTTASGSSYRLDQTTNLSASPISWTTVPGAASVSGNGGTVTVTNLGAAPLPMRYYRARLLP